MNFKRTPCSDVPSNYLEKSNVGNFCPSTHETGAILLLLPPAKGLYIVLKTIVNSRCYLIWFIQLIIVCTKNIHKNKLLFPVKLSKEFLVWKLHFFSRSKAIQATTISTSSSESAQQDKNNSSISNNIDLPDVGNGGGGRLARLPDFGARSLDVLESHRQFVPKHSILNRR